MTAKAKKLTRQQAADVVNRVMRDDGPEMIHLPAKLFCPNCDTQRRHFTAQDVGFPICAFCFTLNQNHPIVKAEKREKE